MAKTKRQSMDRYAFILLLYIALVLLSRVWTIASENWFNGIFWWSICFICFVGTVKYVQRPSHFKAVVYLSLIGAFITGSKLQFTADEWGNVIERASVQGHNMNFTSYAMSGVIVVSLITTTFMRFPFWFRIGLPVIIAALLYFQMQLGSRGALIASTAVITMHVLRNVAPGYVLRSIPPLAFIFTVLFSFGFLEPLFGLMDSSFGRSSGDLSGRAVIWQDAINYITKHPLTGIGVNSFSNVSIMGAGAHNFLLIILLETGILGAALFFVFFASIFRRLARFNKNKSGSYLAGMFSAYWFPLAFSGHWETSPFSWIIVAMFISCSHLNKNADINSRQQ